MLADWRLWLPGQVPVGLVGASAEAAVLRLGRPIAPAAGYRPGGVTFLRNRYLTQALRRGEVATVDGCCLGVVRETGRRATISWAEAEAGVVCTGELPAAVRATGLSVAIAAIQHRKTVLVVDLGAEPPGTDPIGTDPIGAACLDVAAPLRRFGGPSTCYDPLAGASPARATSLVMAMLDWTGVPHAEQLACANYLNAALSLIGAEPTAGVLTELVSRIEGDAAVMYQVTAQLSALGSTRHAASLRPGPGAISITRALAERGVVHFQLGHPRQVTAMIARLVIADLIDILMRHSDTGWRGDCAVWINGCEAIDHRQLGILIALGERTGTAVILGTTAMATATRLAPDVNVVAVAGSAGAADFGEIAALLAGGHQTRLALSVKRPAARLTGCEAVR